ncbi:aldolase [Halorubrum sp. JWXQ-INN 858]|uniref:HpcH/HpaI aldolase family protein n=1 Tax=Halorubrum sp. JWXQ-INN 858 TaxID=2690782 RepID=UPI00135A0A58|nr:aldolase/citrate lyase family protein [Halorubrum sp. JWXQ-INN 858]MWV65577.1 aldolase [Halorubrum sp. JWXQ-INN 858]
MSEDLKAAFERKRHLSATWVSVGNPTVAEVSATRPFDFVLIDTEHTTTSLETVENMHRAVEATPGDTGTVIRVPWNDPVYLKRVLDVGVSGVMVPMIDTVAEAESLVDSLRYPPEGSRGIASGRAAGYGSEFRSYVANADETFVTIAQIETLEGLSNVEAIADVDGIDALFAGPADLSGALGVFGEWDHPEFVAAMDRVIDAAHDAGIPVGTLTVQPADAPPRVEQGFDWQIIGKDTSYLMERHDHALDEYHEAIDRFDG